MKVFAILQHNDPRDSIIFVAGTGDVPTLRKCLEKHPGEVHVGLWLVCTVHIHMYMQIEYYLEFQATIIHFNLHIGIYSGTSLSSQLGSHLVHVYSSH